MNIRGMANGLTTNVNPNIDVIWIKSTGYTTSSSGHRTPTTESVTIKGQVQADSGELLKHIDGLNIQGVLRFVYLYGNAQGVVRPDAKGGDVLQFPQVPGGPVQSWKVVHVMETWDVWCKVIVQLQVNP